MLAGRGRVGRLSGGAIGALPRDVRTARVHPRGLGQGGGARVGQLRVDGHRLETAPGAHAVAAGAMTKRVLSLTAVVAAPLVGGGFVAASSGRLEPPRSRHSEPATEAPSPLLPLPPPTNPHPPPTPTPIP